jgi:hypothetical protein
MPVRRDGGVLHRAFFDDFALVVGEGAHNANAKAPSGVSANSISQTPDATRCLDALLDGDLMLASRLKRDSLAMMSVSALPAFQITQRCLNAVATDNVRRSRLRPITPTTCAPMASAWLCRLPTVGDAGAVLGSLPRETRV